MEFRDLKRQYEYNKVNIDQAIQSVIASSHFIQGEEVRLLEKELSEYVGVKHCITCANGTDALQLALMAWNIGEGDAVFVPDFTFFSSGEVVATVGATPIFVDVDKDTFNVDTEKLEKQIKRVLEKGKLKAKAVVAVDLFGLPADYEELRRICDAYGMYLLEDGAQGFGGSAYGKQACSFGDISTTSFFPAKPLGCYGDGGAIFTDNDEWASLIRSCCVHGKGESKYDNVRIGMNSRLDSIQAAILRAKLPVFINEELGNIQQIANRYNEVLKDIVECPWISPQYKSSWAQFTVKLKNEEERNQLQIHLKEHDIPSMVYYQKPMHRQKAFNTYHYNDEEYRVTNELCEVVLSLPMHSYMLNSDVDFVCAEIRNFMREVS